MEKRYAYQKLHQDLTFQIEQEGEVNIFPI
jgi:hypothetical protein